MREEIKQRRWKKEQRQDVQPKTNNTGHRLQNKTGNKYKIQILTEAIYLKLSISEAVYLRVMIAYPWAT